MSNENLQKNQVFVMEIDDSDSSEMSTDSVTDVFSLTARQNLERRILSDEYTLYTVVDTMTRQDMEEERRRDELAANVIGTRFAPLSISTIQNSNQETVKKANTMIKTLALKALARNTDNYVNYSEGSRYMFVIMAVIALIALLSVLMVTLQMSL